MESLDHDYGFPREEIAFPAVYPPMPLQKLESQRGYMQIITVIAPSNSRGASVVVQKVLRRVSEALRMPHPRRESMHIRRRRAECDHATFREICRKKRCSANARVWLTTLAVGTGSKILLELSPDGSTLPLITVTMCHVRLLVKGSRFDRSY